MDHRFSENDAFRQTQQMPTATQLPPSTNQTWTNSQYTQTYAQPVPKPRNPVLIGALTGGIVFLLLGGAGLLLFSLLNKQPEISTAQAQPAVTEQTAQTETTVFTSAALTEPVQEIETLADTRVFAEAGGEGDSKEETDTETRPPSSIVVRHDDDEETDGDKVKKAVKPPKHAQNCNLQQGLYYINCAGIGYGKNIGFGSLTFDTVKNSVRIDAPYGTAQQRWDVQYVADGKFRFVNQYAADRGTPYFSTMCNEEVIADGAQLTAAFSYLADNTQLFYITPSEEGYFLIQNGKKDNLVLTAESRGSQTRFYLRPYDPDNMMQQWVFYPVPAETAPPQTEAETTTTMTLTVPEVTMIFGEDN